MNIDNIFFQILQVAEQRPDKVAIKTDQGRKVTYAEIVNESTKFAIVSPSVNGEIELTHTT